jgi:hypothetical protein
MGEQFLSMSDPNDEWHKEELARQVKSMGLELLKGFLYVDQMSPESILSIPQMT